MVAEKNRVLSYYAFWQLTFWMSRLVQNEKSLWRGTTYGIHVYNSYSSIGPLGSGFREDFGHWEIIVPGGKSFFVWSEWNEEFLLRTNTSIYNFGQVLFQIVLGLLL